MKKIKVGIVGAGNAGAHHLRALQRLPLVEVTGIADLDPARAQTLARSFAPAIAYASIEQLLASGVDAVHVVTPPDSHAALTIQALQGGAHVLVEKPMAETPAQCDAMIAAARAAGVKLGVVHSSRFDPIVQRGMKFVQDGSIGEVLSVDFHRSSDYPAWAGGGKLPAHYRNGSYPFKDLGVHGLAIAEAFLGHVQSADIDFRSTGIDANLMFDEWTARVDCERGQARLYLSWNVRPIRSQVIVHGTRGVLHIDCFLQTCHITRALPGPKFASSVLCSIFNAATTLYEVPLNVVRFLAGILPAAPGIHFNIQAFYAALVHDTDLPVTAEEGRRLVAIMAPACDKADQLRNDERERQLAPRRYAEALVTGASGFVGSALMRRLVREGKQVRAGVRRIPANPLPGVDYIVGDLGDPDYVDNLVADVGTVFHVGAATKGSDADFRRGTLVGTGNVIDGCVKHRIERLVYVSSLSVLAHVRRRAGRVTEAWPLEPHADRRGAYTQTKLEAECMVLSAVREKGLPAVIIRPGQIFGSEVESKSPAGSFELFGRWIVAGRGFHTLPLVYIDDVVDALLLGASRPGVQGHIVNLVDPACLTQREFIEVVQITNPHIRTLYLPMAMLLLAATGIEFFGRVLGRSVPLSRYRIRSIIPLSDFDQAVARDVLGWSPKVGVAEGVRQILAGSRPIQTALPVQ